MIYKAEWATAKHLLELLLSREQITCCATVDKQAGLSGLYIDTNDLIKSIHFINH